MGYFDPGNPDNPAEVVITRVRPKIFMHLSDDELFELIEKKVRERCIEIQADMRKKGRRFKGLKKLLKEHCPWLNTANKLIESAFPVL